MSPSKHPKTYKMHSADIYSIDGSLFAGNLGTHGTWNDGVGYGLSEERKLHRLTELYIEDGSNIIL